MRTHIKETSKFALLDHWEGNSPVTGEFLARKATNAEKNFHVMTSPLYRDISGSRWASISKFSVFVSSEKSDKQFDYFAGEPPVKFDKYTEILHAISCHMIWSFEALSAGLSYLSRH